MNLGRVYLLYTSNRQTVYPDEKDNDDDLERLERVGSIGSIEQTSCTSWASWASITTIVTVVIVLWLLMIDRLVFKLISLPHQTIFNTSTLFG